MKMIRDYFIRKKERTGDKYDPDSNYEMFFITLLGYAIKTIYSESDDEESKSNNAKAINRIIELFK
jgi:hypothetical protein